MSQSVLNEVSKSLKEINSYLISHTTSVENFAADAPLLTDIDNVRINHVSLDSRTIEKGDLFIAIQGEQQHGVNFLTAVLNKQPGLVISDRALTEQEKNTINSNCKNTGQIQIWVVKEINKILGDFAAWFYNHPSKRLKVVGITGTNGKTSTAFFTAQLLQSLNYKVGLIGTLGNGPIDNLTLSANTTPNSVTVHRLLNEFAEQGLQWVIMEVSSHALCLGRIQGVTFQTIALTQVTRDHMDFHGTVESYTQAKARLFSEYPAKYKVLNLVDNLGYELCTTLAKDDNHQTVWCYQTKMIQRPGLVDTRHENTLQASLQTEALELTSEGIGFKAKVFDSKTNKTGYSEYIKLPLLGAFNLENVFCALSILLVNEIRWSQIKPHISKLQSVAGRMQVLNQSPTIILDFAHTPDALEQVLSAVKSHLSDSHGKSKGVLSVVFGCGGNRDQGKRPLMGAIAETLADRVMLTSDNPRDEEPEIIIEGIQQGLQNPANVEKELDRKQAIFKVLNQAKKDDIVLIAGKGHEDYQEINGVKTFFSDAQVVSEWLLNSNKMQK